MIDLRDYIRHLARNEELILRAYGERTIAATGETERQISKLVSARILLSDEDGGYRLAPKVRTGFDYFLDVNRAFSGGGAIAPEILRLHNLIDAINEAGREGREASIQEYEPEAIEVIWSIKDMIEAQLRVFDLMTRNGYHDAKTLAERQKRNAFYLGIAKELLDAVSNLNDQHMRDLMRGPHAVGVNAFFSRHIISRIESWSSALGGLISEMLEYMHRTKAVADQTKRMRAILHAMRDITEGDFIEVLAAAPRQMGTDVPDIRVSVDPRSERNEIDFSTAAQKINPDESLVRKRTTRGSGHQDADVGIDDVLGADRSDIDDLADELLASSDPISVRDWAGRRGISEVFVLVTDAFDLVTNDPEGRFSMQTVPPKSETFTSGVRDLILQRAA